MTDPGPYPILRGRCGWAHRVRLPADNPFVGLVADLWSVHLVAEGTIRVVHSYTVELVGWSQPAPSRPGCVDDGSVTWHTLWVTHQGFAPFDVSHGPVSCRWEGWRPGPVLVRHEFEPVAELRWLTFPYQVTERLVNAAIDHGASWFSPRGMAAVTAAIRIDESADPRRD